MSKSTGPITYHYDVNGKDVAVTRHHLHTAYARNGNVHNPTEYFDWSVAVDGKHVRGYLSTRGVAYEYGRAHVEGVPYRFDEGAARRSEGVRHFRVVAEEMKRNYRSKVVCPTDGA